MEVSPASVGWLSALLLAVGGSGGLFGLLSERSRLKADLAKSLAAAPAEEGAAVAQIGTALAAFQEAMNRSTGAFVETLIGERETREREIGELKARIELLEHENEQCRGEARQMQQMFDSLVAELRRRGINIAAKDYTGPFIVFEDGKTTVLRPSGHEDVQDPTTEPGGKK